MSIRIIARFPSIQFAQAPELITGTIAPDHSITGQWQQGSGSFSKADIKKRKT